MQNKPELTSSTTFSFTESSVDEGKKRSRRKSFFRREGLLHISTASSCDADISTIECERDLTPGSLKVWEDLPDEIKYDPALAPFKQLYEEQHPEPIQELDTIEQNEGDRTIFTRAAVPEITIDHVDECNNNSNLHKNSGDRLMESSDEQAKAAEKASRKKRLDRTLRILKLSGLVACWVFLTVSLVMNRERDVVELHTAVRGREIKEYHLQPSNERVKVAITLTGPFAQTSVNETEDQHCLFIWLSRTIHVNSSGRFEQNSTLWKVHLQPKEIIDFSPSVSETKNLDLDVPRSPNGKVYDDAPGNETLDITTQVFNLISTEDLLNATSVTLRMHSSGESTVPLTISYQMNPIDEREGLIYATVLLCALYVLIIFEVINRTIAALLSSSLAVAVLALSGERPSLPELLSWLDVETLLLLFSMMLLVAILSDTGLFDYLAILAFELTGGRTWPLINCLCLFTAIFSTFLDNVTTVLLMTPVTIRLCEVMQLNPVPVLMSMVIFSNVGGAATPVGDPPNVIIASHPSVLKENINFTTFTLHMGLGILLVSIQTYFQLRFMYRDMNKLRHSVPTDIQEMRQEIAVWRRAAASLSSYSRDENVVRKTLERKVDRLHLALMKREAGTGSSKNDPRFSSTLAQMKEKYRIRNKELLIKSVICVSFVVVVFFLHAIPELQRLSLGWTALLGAMLLLLLAELDDLEPILARVEWSTLLFFAALFVMMEALSKLGLISWIGRMTEALILQVGEESRLAVALMLVLWVSGLASAFVDNIPLTTMMVRVTAALADPNGLGLPLAPLCWALSFGACLGGNGTLIGASANVVCAGVAEQHGYRFTFLQFLKVGFPVMVGNLLVSSVYLLFCHCVFTWH